MRLLEIQADGSFRLTKPLLDPNIPRYAILSHTWGLDSEEVIFEDLEQGCGSEKAGYEKIKFCAQQAHKDGLKFFWVDSCCIKKSSDAELSEAINSMYSWYRRATKCYVYLTDVTNSDPRKQQEEAFWNSNWFKRGWTLQELLAPTEVQFFCKEGQLLGDKDTLKRPIHEITGIPLTALSGTPLDQFSIDARFKWTENRQTTRKEDRAYCLLGIFGVFIPPIYGEGDFAFTRLREAISRTPAGRERDDGFSAPLVAADDFVISRPTQFLHTKSGRPFERKPEARAKFFESLRFKYIEDRYNNIRLAHSDTCRWLLANQRYLAWLDQAQITQHHGLLWLKGKPGTGKSTLLKFAVSEARRTRPKDIHVSFFFNARGSPLEKDTRGMYRSILYQLLTELPRAQEVFDEFGNFELPKAPDFAWTVPQLKAVLDAAIRELKGRRLWMYVDALDECDEDQVRDMVVFFNLLGNHTVTSGINMRVFFASRHYPRITTPKKIELRLEDEEEHSRDIERYLESELRTGDNTRSKVVQRIRGEVQRRASGVFIWVVLVVQILNKAYDHGQIAGLEKKLRDIPDDLGQLFKGILTRDGQNMESMRLCIQWILFAKRPLTREELYFAIYAGTNPEEMWLWDPEAVTADDMEAFILSCSKGLAEFTQSGNVTVQFIHETIRDFLLKENGMRYIQGPSTQSLLSSAHDSLKQCCVSYISAAEGILLDGSVTANTVESGGLPATRSLPMPRHQPQGHIPISRLPFIDYALWNVLHHANAAEADGVSQVPFLQNFRVHHWAHLTNIMEHPDWARTATEPVDTNTPNSFDPTLLCTLANLNLPALIGAMLVFDPKLDVEGAPDVSPLRTALKLLHFDALGALLTPVRDGSARYRASFMRPPEQYEMDSLIYTYYCLKKGTSVDPILQLYFHWGTESDIHVLLRSGRFSRNANISKAIQSSPLSIAAERGWETLVTFLLSKDDVDPNLQDYLGLSPLSRAAREGQYNIVQLLVQSPKVDLNTQCAAGRTPLSLAAEKGHEDVVKLLLLQPDIDINLGDQKQRTPFFFAAMRGRDDILRLLINTPNVDVVSRDTIGQTALSYAVLNGHENVVRRLLSTGKAEVNSRDTIHGHTPLLFALKYGYQSIVKLLLNNPDIDVNISNKRGRTPLDFAREQNMHEEAEIIRRRALATRDEFMEEDFTDTMSGLSVYSFDSDFD